jgi:hypothetical protein
VKKRESGLQSSLTQQTTDTKLIQNECGKPNPTQIHATGEAIGFIPAPGDKRKPITVIGTNLLLQNSFCRLLCFRRRLFQHQRRFQLAKSSFKGCHR